MSDSSPVCPICGGRKAPGTTTFSADIGSGVVLVRHVRATVCQQCGEEWIDHATAQRLEAIVAEARAKKRQLEVADLAAA
jgi:YgiT-type zinc finger domain-containing protein